ncbi:MAG TPA: tyrosine-type recombinase/integrase [bacterium]|nr:tyrosine-type recombinase/integrase [bacterium]
MRKKPIRITKRIIDGLRYEGNPDGSSQCITWDSELKGFGVRCFATGIKSFVLWYYFQGTRRRLTLGQYGAMTLDQAKRKARSILGQVGLGTDPAGEKRAQEKESLTVRGLSEHFMREYSIPHKRSTSEDQRRFRMHILPAIGNRRADSVTTADITRIHNDIGNDQGHPREANNVRNLIATTYRFAIENGYLLENHPNPARRVKKFQEQTRDRYLAESEWPILAESIDREENPFVRAAFMLLLLTGIRKGELLRMQWSDINFETVTLRIPLTKGGEPRTIPLNSAAIEILKSLPRQSDFVIAGKNPGEPFVGLQKCWARIIRRSGIEDLRIHDLRRSHGSWALSHGVSLETVSRLLGHRSVRITEQVYAFMSDDLPRAGTETVSKVVQFSRIKREKESTEKSG